MLLKRFLKLIIFLILVFKGKHFIWLHINPGFCVFHISTLCLKSIDNWVYRMFTFKNSMVLQQFYSSDFFLKSVFLSQVMVCTCGIMPPPGGGQSRGFLHIQRPHVKGKLYHVFFTLQFHQYKLLKRGSEQYYILIGIMRCLLMSESVLPWNGA